MYRHNAYLPPYQSAMVTILFHASAISQGSYASGQVYYIKAFWDSVMCRSLSLAIHLSASPQEKADARQAKLGFHTMPTAVNFYSGAGNLSCIEVSSAYESQ